MLRCSKCPGSYGAVFCGMVQLGLRTCGFKWGELYLLLILSSTFLNELRIVIFHGGFCADMRLYLDTVLRAASWANVDRVSLVPPLSLVWPLCTRSGMLVYFGVHVMSAERNCFPKSLAGGTWGWFQCHFAQKWLLQCLLFQPNVFPFTSRSTTQYDFDKATYFLFVKFLATIYTFLQKTHLCLKWCVMHQIIHDLAV